VVRVPGAAGAGTVEVDVVLVWDEGAFDWVVVAFC
jgi:hypothetical protein